MSTATATVVNKSYDINQTVTYEVEQLSKCIYIYKICTYLYTNKHQNSLYTGTQYI